MTTRLFVVGVFILASAGTDLLACGEKFLVMSRGTRFQRAGVARQPAKILVYANPSSTLPKALERAMVGDTLRKAGYRPTLVAAAGDLDLALRQGGWDLVVADLGDSTTLRARLQSSDAPMVMPVVLNATGVEIAKAKKDFQRVIKGPVKSQAFLDAVDDALALREKLRGKTV